MKYHGNQYELSFWGKAAKFTKRTIIVTGGMSALGWAAYLGSNYVPRTVYADKVVEVPAKVEFPLILTKICFAESGGRQFNKDGSVLRGRTTPSDIGICQINEAINNDLARKLGYDIFTEEGNKAFALYLFNHRGTEPWNASKANWLK